MPRWDRKATVDDEVEPALHADGAQEQPLELAGVVTRTGFSSKGGSKMKKNHWNRYQVMRVVLALGSIVSMILASGAGTNWN